MIHAEVLPDEQLACLRVLGPAATDLGFHLAGGTAVALTLGHRRSVDFDWFTPRFPGQPVDLAESLARRGVALEPSTLAERTVHGFIAGIRVTFLEFRPPLLEPLVAWPELGCRLASVADLAAMKLLAVEPAPIFDPARVLASQGDRPLAPAPISAFSNEQQIIFSVGSECFIDRCSGPHRSRRRLPS